MGPLSIEQSPGAEAGSPRLRITRADDVVMHAANLSGWRQQYDQLAPGAFQGALDELWLDEMQVFHERTSHALLQGCSIREETVWCGVTATHDGTRIEGREVGGGGVMVCGRHTEFELRTPDAHDIYGIVVARDTLARHAELLGLTLGPGAPNLPGWLACEALTHARLCGAMTLLMAQATQAGSALHHPVARRHIRHALLDRLLAVLASPVAALNERTSFARRRLLVGRVREYLRAHQDESPTVPDLCAQFHVSRRTLQYAFESVVGLSPLACLRRLRLNAVRRALLMAETCSVQQAATEWGFWNLSQFACDYRRHFGERPSDTSNRARPGKPAAH